MKINGVHERGVKNYLADDPQAFVWALHGCVKDAFELGKIPVDIQEKFALLNKNAATLSKQFQEVLAFLRLYKTSNDAGVQHKDSKNELADNFRVRRAGPQGEDVGPRAIPDRDIGRMEQEGKKRPTGKDDLVQGVGLGENRRETP